MQRLSEEVLEAEIFERQMKINAAKTWRQYVGAPGGGGSNPDEKRRGQPSTLTQPKRRQQATQCKYKQHKYTKIQMH